MAITHLVQAGVDLPTVKRISGHKTMIMVERYAHQSGTHIAEAMSKLDDRYRKRGIAATRTQSCVVAVVMVKCLKGMVPRGGLQLVNKFKALRREGRKRKRPSPGASAPQPFPTSGNQEHTGKCGDRSAILSGPSASQLGS
jgi:hypothetical protein